jgi:hypothetical protein
MNKEILMNCFRKLMNDYIVMTKKILQKLHSLKPAYILMFEYLFCLLKEDYALNEMGIEIFNSYSGFRGSFAIGCIFHLV